MTLVGDMQQRSCILAVFFFFSNKRLMQFLQNQITAHYLMQDETTLEKHCYTVPHTKQSPRQYTNSNTYAAVSNQKPSHADRLESRNFPH